ncbi:AMP-binding enzyme, putative [Coccidioides posadasii C735 delta SOWgp]|uniref:AMP-binding enzyme, putative n=1 Tax=Coccidioides posadasii (strain C735) TaxID=222929 RepID=C5P5A7_COCP7|nr:AMP-binding enzyme, putative [Coccidioides posadasii C735 delta SOWgp]EER27897.1 AMP-binding enzyme, putative [Coccidioides posadasii C735 delta SOWgp]|eukprot:XP_003070042.1 AMP-binding enzyme, putative [Coccidioides posadasii C735 delta SOWgp]
MPFRSRWSIPIPNTSLPSLIFKSPQHPHSDTRKCYVDTTRPDTHFFTVHGYFLWCKRLAAGLRKSGLKSGDRVLLFSANTLMYPVAFMGIVMAGCVFTGANPTYTPRELAYQLSDSGATYLLCAESALDTGIAAAEQSGLARDRIFVFNDLVYDGTGEGTKGCRYWGELFASTEEGERFSWEELSTPEAADRTLALNYSSGTTGVPKGVQITHKNYVANTLQFTNSTYLDKDHAEKLKRTRWMCFLPMYHAMAQNIFIAAALILGVPVYLMPRFDFIQMLENTQTFRISNLILVPPIAVALAKHPAVKNYDLSSLEQIGCGAAPLGREISEELEGLFPKGKLFIRQGWGMTETTCSILGWDPNQKGTSASVGELNPNCEAKIMAEDGVTELGRNQQGELWVRGPNIMKGYWNKPEATKETLTEDRWLKTGDIGYVDDAGKFYILDRKKELIKVKGNQVAPAELEAILLDHSAVADAAVIGVTKDNEEYPRAYIILKPGSPATVETAQNIVDYMKDKVAPVKRITGGIVFVDTIPKNPSGKILRRELRDRARSEIKAGLASSKL